MKKLKKIKSKFKNIFYLNKSKINRTTAFSLVELMISLTVISVLLAAFVPVMTKKSKKSVNVAGYSSLLTENCSDTFGQYCALCRGDDYCISCTIPCNSSCYKNVSSCSCNPCTDYDTNCITCTESGCTGCTTGYYLSSSGKCEADRCSASYGLVRVYNASVDLCATMFNLGDHSSYSSLSSWATVKTASSINSDDSYCNASSGNCCWQGVTSSNCDTANGNYSGCNRTVCNWYAANAICEGITIAGWDDWRLPNKSEMSGILNAETASTYLGTSGLQYCDYYFGYGSSWCHNNSGQCWGAGAVANVAGNCTPRYVWTGTQYGTRSAYYYHLMLGNWSRSYSNKSYARSARCVREMD